MFTIPKIIVFWRMPKKEKFILIEAFIFLGWSRILKNIPFKKLAPLLGTHMSELPYQNNPAVKDDLRAVSSAIHLMSKYTIWESQCLVKAIAAMKMLKRRGIGTTLYLGISKDIDGKMIAHAWLRNGTYYISGYEEMRKFTVVSMFSTE
jgi:hypothetical protein